MYYWMRIHKLPTVALQDADIDVALQQLAVWTTVRVGKIP